MRVWGPLTFCLIALVSAACTASENQLSGTWYNLQNGKFEKSDSPSSLPEKGAAAWQHQERIADISVFRGNPVFLVNGHGVILMNETEKTGQFTYYYNDIFRENTATAFFINGGSLFCHVYYDKAFLTVNEEQTEPEPLCFVKLTISDDGKAAYDFLQSVFHARSRKWEAVGAYALDKTSVVLELKQSQNDFTQFGYTVYNFETGTEEEKSREWFTESFQIQEIVDTETKDTALSKIFDKSISVLTGRNQPMILHFNVRDQISHTEKRFRFSSADAGSQAEFKRILVDSIGNHYIALLPDGTIFTAEKGNTGSITTFHLPSLPEYFEYTGFVFNRNRLSVVWEESDAEDFYKIRKSGFLHIDSFPLD